MFFPFSQAGLVTLAEVMQCDLQGEVIKCNTVSAWVLLILLLLKLIYDAMKKPEESVKRPTESITEGPG
jgi:hypothetical protein